MTSSTNPTETISDEAVEAAAEAIRQHWDLPESSIRPHVINDARVALAAAFPALRAQIETEVRQQIAGEIIAACPYNCELRYDGTEDPQAAAWLQGMYQASEIALGKRGVEDPSDNFAAVDAYIAGLEDESGIADMIGRLRGIGGRS